MTSSRGDSLDLRKQSVRGGAWAAAGAAGSAGIGLANFLILSRLLDPSVYGLMGMVESSLAIAQRLMSSGLSEPLIQLPDLGPEHSDTMFWTLQIFGVGMAVAAIGASSWISGFFGEPALVALISVSALTVYLQATSLVPGALLARRFAFQESAQANVISELAGGAVGIASALAGHGVWALVAQRLVSASVSCAMLWWRARWRPSVRWSFRAFHAVWRYSASRAAEGLLLYVDQHAPRIILGRVAGAAELGYFVFARRLSENSVSLMNAPLRTTALSTFAAIQDDLPRVRRAYAEGITLTTAFLFPASVGVALVAPDLVRVLGGATWLPAAVLLQLLILAGIRQSFHIWNAAMLRGLGAPQRLLGASLLRTCAILGLIYLMLDRGAPGVALAILAGACISWPAAVWFVREISGLSPWDQWRPSRMPMLATVAMGCAVYAVRQAVAGSVPAIGSLAISVGTGAVVYGAVMAVFGKSELASMLRAIEVLRPKSRGRRVR